MLVISPIQILYEPLHLTSFDNVRFQFLMIANHGLSTMNLCVIQLMALLDTCDRLRLQRERFEQYLTFSQKKEKKRRKEGKKKLS